MKEVFKTILLLALPASGKSEVRNFMANMDGEWLKKEFHIGENLQLDDFPYVHFMRRIDEELDKLGEPRVFYPSNEVPFFDNRDWGTLILLLDQDYSRMMNREYLNVSGYAEELFGRIDDASEKVGIARRIQGLSEEVRHKLAEALEAEAKVIAEEKERQYTSDYEGKTLIIECARGGPDGFEMPLTEGYGYQYSLPKFSPAVLDNAVILYIWVTPEESRRKNNERANPDDPGSNLFHGVPMAVMLGDYGCDDMEYLRSISDMPDTVAVKNDKGQWHIPIGVFDNRTDSTSFLRKDKDQWTEEEIQGMKEKIKSALDLMWEKYNR